MSPTAFSTRSRGCGVLLMAPPTPVCSEFLLLLQIPQGPPDPVLPPEKGPESSLYNSCSRPLDLQPVFADVLAALVHFTRPSGPTEPHPALTQGPGGGTG